MSSTVVKELLDIAGLSAVGLRTESLSGGQTNATQLVHSASGKHVARLYRWPHDSEELDRPVKEKYLHSIRRERGVPVPAVLASVDSWKGYGRDTSRHTTNSGPRFVQRNADPTQPRMRHGTVGSHPATTAGSDGRETAGPVRDQLAGIYGNDRFHP